MKSYLLLLIFIVLYGCNYSQSNSNKLLAEIVDTFYDENKNEKVIKLSNLAQYNNDLTANEKQIVALVQVAAYCELSDMKTAQKLFFAIDSTFIASNKELIYWYNTVGGLFYFRANNFPKSLQMLNKSVEQNFSDKANALSYRLMARIHFSTGDANKASEFLALSTDLFSKTKLYKSIGINHKILGRQFAAKHEFETAETHFDIALKAMTKSNDSLELFYVYINLLDLQLKQKNYQQAKQRALKCASFISHRTDNQALALLYNNFAEIEFLLNNNDSCRYYYQKTLDLPSGYISDILRQGNAHIGISKSYLAQNNVVLARASALKALQVSMLSNTPELQYNANVHLAVIYNKMGNSNAAYEHLAQANLYLQNLANESKKNTETVYQSTINLLKVQSVADEIKAEKQLYFFMVIAGFLFLIFASIYIVSTYRLMRSRNSTLKVLVHKNLQIIDDERKLNIALRERLDLKKNNRRIVEEEKHIHLYSQCVQWLSADRNFARKDLSADIVARELNTNRDYLARAMAEQNTRFNELLSKIRIEEAVRILSSKCDKRRSYNLNIIAGEVGFNSNSVFIDAFRKQTGMNPAQFRETACANIVEYS